MYRFELLGLENERDNFLRSCTSDAFTDQNGLVLPLLMHETKFKVFTRGKLYL